MSLALIWLNQKRAYRNVPLIEIVVVIIIVGVLLWLVNSYIPMAGPIKSLLNAVVVIALIVWILKMAGLWHQITNIRVGS
jgi:uncharacterized membrane protein YkgB